MKAIPARDVRKVLKRFGLQPQARGNATGHEAWVDACGRTCRPVLRKKDVSIAVVFSLSKEWANKGITSRQAFLGALRAA
jgi:hypothetical protein